MKWLIFASTRSVQIATRMLDNQIARTFLCLHTLRADCNGWLKHGSSAERPLPPHAPCRLQPRFRSSGVFTLMLCLHTLRADCNRLGSICRVAMPLCLHTLRADCNGRPAVLLAVRGLCLHTLRADCNGIDKIKRLSPKNFASTRSVQIATLYADTYCVSGFLCLHTLRADCNAPPPQKSALPSWLCLHTLRADCNMAD